MCHTMVYLANIAHTHTCIYARMAAMQPIRQATPWASYTMSYANLSETRTLTTIVENIIYLKNKIPCSFLCKHTVQIKLIAIIRAVIRDKRGHSQHGEQLGLQHKDPLHQRWWNLTRSRVGGWRRWVVSLTQGKVSEFPDSIVDSTALVVCLKLILHDTIYSYCLQVRHGIWWSP